MAHLLSNNFESFALADEKHGTESKTTNKATTSLPDVGKKKQQQRGDAKKKKESKSIATMMTAKPIVAESELLSLKEYEKVLLEKKKVLNAIIKKPDGQQEEEKVSPDKNFEGMKVIGKKKEDDADRFVKPKFDKKKAAGSAKVHKVVAMDVNGFLKPLGSERSFAGNGRGKFTGGFSGEESAPVAENGGTSNTDPSTLNIEDHSQFPDLA